MEAAGNKSRSNATDFIPGDEVDSKNSLTIRMEHLNKRMDSDSQQQINTSKDELLDDNVDSKNSLTIRMEHLNKRMDSDSQQQINTSKDELLDDNEGNFLSRGIITVRSAFIDFLIRHRRKVHLLLTTAVMLSIVCYLLAAVWNWNKQGRKRLKWCAGDGFLLIFFFILALGMIYHRVLKPLIFKPLTCTKDSSQTLNKCMRIWKLAFLCCLVVAIMLYIIMDAIGEPNRLISIGGIFIFIAIGFISSKHPNQVKWRTVFMGLLLQTIFGILTIRWEVGRNIFLCIGNRVERFLRFGYEGATFVYGNYLINELQVFAFKSLSVIYFIGMIIEILFYLGWMQKMCFNMGWGIQKILGTTIIESVNAVTTVFLGLSEAPLLYRPYIKDLTPSELHAVMAGGFSTVAGTVFAAYTALGVNPSYLITASIMAAPAALCYAKLLYPETEVSKTTAENFTFYESEEKSIINAACKGALSGISLIFGIIATVIASVSLVAFFSSSLEWFGLIVGVEGLTFQAVVGKILLPIAYIMGVKSDQCEHVAKLIGIKLSLNEFLAYGELGKMKNILTPRSEAIATFALCSFANPGSLGSFISLLVNLCPSQKHNVSRVALRALLSGATTSMLTACVAGMLMPEYGFQDAECINCNGTSSIV